MKNAHTVLAFVAVALLAVIAYTNSLGKVLPPTQQGPIACDSALTQSLFFSQLLSRNGLDKLAKQVNAASNINRIHNLVTSGSTIAAGRTLWFRSTENLSDCQAQIFLQGLNSDGNNTAYVGYTIKGFVPTDGSAAYVLEFVRIHWMGIQWSKQ